MALFPVKKTQSMPANRQSLFQRERQAMLGSEGYPDYNNRFITESDPSRQLDLLLTDGDLLLLDAGGSVLWG